MRHVGVDPCSSAHRLEVLPTVHTYCTVQYITLLVKIKDLASRGSVQGPQSTDSFCSLIFPVRGGKKYGRSLGICAMVAAVQPDEVESADPSTLPSLARRGQSYHANQPGI